MTAGPTVHGERATGYILVAGLAVSVSMIVLGIISYQVQTGGSTIEYTPQWQMTGPNFFSYAQQLLGSVTSAQTPALLMALGVVFLMLTSYARVLTTTASFLFQKNRKYVIISLFVLAVLTLTLLLH